MRPGLRSGRIEVTISLRGTLKWSAVCGAAILSIIGTVARADVVIIDLADTDDPDTSSGVLPHHGFQIELNGNLVAGPGHVFSTKERPIYSRGMLGEQYHEIREGVFWGRCEKGDPNTVKEVPGNLRLDYSLRLWRIGRDINASSRSAQEYDREVYGPLAEWIELAQGRPGFGLEKRTK